MTALVVGKLNVFAGRVAKESGVGTCWQRLAQAVLAQHAMHRQQDEEELDDCAVRGELR